MTKTRESNKLLVKGKKSEGLPMKGKKSEGLTMKGKKSKRIRTKGKESNGLPMKAKITKFVMVGGSNPSKHLRRNKSPKQITTLDPKTWTVRHLIRLNIQLQYTQDSTPITPFTFPYNQETYRVLIDIIYAENPYKYPLPPTVPYKNVSPVMRACSHALYDYEDPGFTDYFASTVLHYIYNHVLPPYSGGKYLDSELGPDKWFVISIVPASRIIALTGNRFDKEDEFDLSLVHDFLPAASLSLTTAAMLDDGQGNCWPVTAVLYPSHGGYTSFAEETAHLLCLAQEIFERLPEVDECQPALFSSHESYFFLLSMKVSRSYMQRAKSLRPDGMMGGEPVILRKEKRWNFQNVEDRKAFVDYAMWWMNGVLSSGGNRRAVYGIVKGENMVKIDQEGNDCLPGEMCVAC
jgi:hypothetical protein